MTRSRKGAELLTAYESGGYPHFKNRIINGAMMIDQRNAGASVTSDGSAYKYPVDRFAGYGDTSDGVFTLQQSSSAPSGFTKSIKATVTTADSSLSATNRYFIRQSIEGNNVADFGFGAAGASTMTLSFWVRSSITGQHSGSILNDNFDRAYPYVFTISAADTWEYKTVTIAGDTTGTWLKDNGAGMSVIWNLGAGSSRVGTSGAWQTPSMALFGATGSVNVIATNGATFYITGVQLEKSSTATSFDYRPYGTELALCQRYYEKSFDPATAPAQNAGTTSGALVYTTQTTGTQYITAGAAYAVLKRAQPTITTYNPFSANTGWSASGSGNYTASVYSNGASGIVLRNDTVVSSSGTNMSIHWTASAEL